MPIRSPVELPAKEILEKENIFIMDEGRASTQDIRPLKIAILNLMPTKIVTETQILRLLSNSPLQTDICLMTTASRKSAHTPETHLKAFYRTFEDVRYEKFDGLIITGAPVEHLDFTEVDYWDELCDILEWSKHNVFSRFYICWGAYAALYYNLGIKKYKLDEKLSGIFAHKTLMPSHPLARGFDETFFAPHSRYTGVDMNSLEECGVLDIIAASQTAGPYIFASKNGRDIYVTGHSEYDSETLALEYKRDVEKGINPKIPVNYFPGDNPLNSPVNTWRSHAHLLFSNWLNYFVYQQTPYNSEEII